MIRPALRIRACINGAFALAIGLTDAAAILSPLGDLRGSRLLCIAHTIGSSPDGMVGRVTIPMASPQERWPTAPAFAKTQAQELGFGAIGVGANHAIGPLLIVPLDGEDAMKSIPVRACMSTNPCVLGDTQTNRSCGVRLGGKHQVSMGPPNSSGAFAVWLSARRRSIPRPEEG